MSHFKIFQVSEEPVPVDEHINECQLYEDELFNTRSDWGGDAVTGEEKKRAILHLGESMKDIAVVDAEKETISFLPKKDVLSFYEKHVRRLFDQHIGDIAKGVDSYRRFHRDLEDVVDSAPLFYDTYCKSSSYLVQDYVNGYLPQVLHIGAVLDAHC